MYLPKPERAIDPVFLDRVRRLRCLVSMCSSIYTDPHHLCSRGSGGSDYTAVPLCRKHHTEIHTIGVRRFEDEHGVNLWRISSEILADFTAELVAELDEKNAQVLALKCAIRSLEDSAYNERED